MKFYMIAFLSAAIIASDFVAKAEEVKCNAATTKEVVKKSLSQDDAVNLLNDAASQVQVGGVYFSSYIPDDLYLVLTVAIDTNTLEEVVVYQALFGVNAIWVRPVSEWVQLVNVDGSVVPHYQLVDQVADVYEVDLVTDAVIAEEVLAAEESAVVFDAQVVEDEVSEEVDSL